MTRAKQHLHLIHPLRFFRIQQQRFGDGHVFAPLTRFIPDAIVDRFDKRSWPQSPMMAEANRWGTGRIDVAARMREMWR